MRVAVSFLALCTVGVSGIATGLPTDLYDSDYGTGACADTADTGCCCSTMKRNNGLSACTDVEKLVCVINSKSTTATKDCSTTFGKLETDGNQLWMIICGSLVVFMQCGFAMLEAGSIRKRNTNNIIFKNVIDICMAAILYYLIGHGFAYGKSSNHMIGTTNFVLMRESNDESGMAFWFFQFAFAGTASTIVSGAVAERTKLVAYFFVTFFITAFVYPVVVHWVWSSDGWLSAFAPANVRLGANGMIDFAGSGVVHAVGGFAGLCGTIVLGPRWDRFEETDEQREQMRKETIDRMEAGEVEEECCEGGANTRGCCKMGMFGEARPIQGQSTMVVALGVFILWFGWYGFNCGSTLAFDGKNAGHVAVTTTLSAASGALTCIIITRLHLSAWDVGHSLNGVLAGLVSITAGCPVVEDWAAIVIGVIGGGVYYGAVLLLEWLKIDDPVQAWPVHGACGVWGVVAVGIFAQGQKLGNSYPDADLHAVTRGTQLWTQVAGIVSIVMWTCCCMIPCFLLLDKTIGIRVSSTDEDAGLDAVDHGMNPTASFQSRVQARITIPGRQEDKNEPTQDI